MKLSEEEIGIIRRCLCAKMMDLSVLINGTEEEDKNSLELEFNKVARIYFRLCRLEVTGGFCRILIDNNFGKRKCPFYKTKWQISQEEKKAAEKFLGEEGN